MNEFDQLKARIHSALDEAAAKAETPIVVNLHFHFHSRPPSAILQTASTGSEAEPPERPERTAPAPKIPLPRAGDGG